LPDEQVAAGLASDCRMDKNPNEIAIAKIITDNLILVLIK
jgi:hypothetical protein